MTLFWYQLGSADNGIIHIPFQGVVEDSHGKPVILPPTFCSVETGVSYCFRAERPVVKQAGGKTPEIFHSCGPKKGH